MTVPAAARTEGRPAPDRTLTVRVAIPPPFRPRLGRGCETSRRHPPKSLGKGLSSRILNESHSSEVGRGRLRGGSARAGHSVLECYEQKARGANGVGHCPPIHPGLEGPRWEVARDLCIA